MTEPDISKKEALLAELELHKAEFVALREEILHSIDADRQSLYLSLVAIGAGLGLTPFIAEQNSLVILLLFPLIFHIILWEMLSSIRTVSRISDYLTDKLIPRVNAILDELGNTGRTAEALGWEAHIATLPFRTLDLIVTALTPTRHWMPILAVAALIIAYVFASNAYGHSPSSYEIGLVILNLFLLVWAAVQNTLTASTSMRHAEKLKRSSRAEHEQTHLQHDPKEKKRKK